MKLWEILDASKLQIAAVLAITLLYYALTFAIAPNLYSAASSPLGAVSSLEGAAYVTLLLAIGIVLAMMSLTATFYIGFGGAKHHDFGYEEAVVAGAMAGVANGVLSLLLSLALASGLLGAFAPLGTSGAAFAGAMLLVAAAFGSAYAIGGTILAAAFSFFGCLIARGFK